MSDEEEEWVSEDESEPDFSASEDEWRPTKQDKESSDSDFQVDKHSDDEDVGSTRKRELPKGRSSSSSSSTRGRGAPSGSGGPPTKKRFSQSLRNKLYNKYRPPPKTLSPVKLNSNLSNILESSKYTRKTSAASSRQEDEDDSDSSGDDNLVNPNKIDLTSSFFQKIKKTDCPKSDVAPDFDCNVGCLTDSGSDEDDDDPEKQPQTSENFSKLHNFNSTLERAREALKKYQANNVERAYEHLKADDIGALLAAGEKVEPEPSQGNKLKSASKRKQTATKHDPDSEWEDVNELEVKPKTEPSRADGSVQITVQLPGGHETKRNKQLELELCLKRKLNRIKKENQLDLHKTNVLCWIAHMNYVNQILNNPLLMTEALKIIPSSQSYPKDKTDIDYFEQLSRFYKTVIVVKNNIWYPPLKKRPSLELSLGLQIKNKSAICKRDYVFIFVILARAIGLQCRIVYNFVVASIRPALADLVPINRSAEPKKNDKRVKKENLKQETLIPVVPESFKKESAKIPQLIKTKSVKADLRNKKELPAIAQSIKKESVKAGPKTSKVPIAVVVKKSASKTTVPEKKIDNVIKSQTIRKSDEPKKITDSPSQFKKSVNLSKLRLAKKNGKPAPTVNSPIKTRSRASTKILQIEQMDGADDVFAEPKRKQRASCIKKVKANEVPSSSITTKKSIAKSSLTKKEQPIVLSASSNSSTSKGQKVKLTRMEAAKSCSSQEKPTNIVKLKAINNVVVKKRRYTAKQDDSDEDLTASPVKKATTVKHKTNRPVSAANGKKSEKPIDRRCLSPEQEVEKPTNVVKLKAIDNVVVKKRRSAAKQDDSDEDFKASSVKKATTVKHKTNRSVSAANEKKSEKPIDRRCLSPEEETEIIKKKADCSDYWVELYSEKSKRWYCVDLFRAKVDCAEDLYRQATHPVAYVLAWQNDNTLKDVSPRYCMHWNTTTRTLRVPQYWLDEAFKSFLGKKTDRDKREDLELNKLHMDQPLPKVIGEFKNHPLYALRRHLLKFEAIYPAEAVTLGFIRNEPIYARECVHTLHSREIWVKQARVVKPGETPYKIVTARPKWDRLTQTVIKGVPLEIFGIWQTKEYEPPTAENGIVPRNAYGNVELFKECMLPKKTLHLRLNGLNRVCKKLGIDCAPAVVGFDFHSGSCHPVFDGFVICEEFGDKVVEAWFDDQADQEKREREKYEKRVYGNWKRIIRGLLIREKIKIKYNLEPLKLDG